MIEQYAEAQWDMNMSRKRTETDRGNFGSSVRGSYLAVRGMFYRIGGSAGTWWNGMLHSPSTGVSAGATSLAANLFSSSLSNSSVSMYRTSKWRSHSFAQCPVFPQYRQVSGVALAFRAVSMSIGTGLPGDRFEWVNHGGGAAGSGRDIARGRLMDGVRG